jgi:transcriptional regulator with XRE-family HTH domain
MNIDGKKLLTVRTALKLTQKEMAKEMGVAFQTLSAVENGREIPDSKQRFYEVALKEVTANYKREDILHDVGIEYLKSEQTLNDRELLFQIISEIQTVRKENKQLNDSIAQIKEDNSTERKMNDLLRKQLQLAINVLKNLDLELNEREKSTSAKQNISKIK